MGQDFEEVQSPHQDTIYHSFDGEKILMGSGVKTRSGMGSGSGWSFGSDSEYVLSQAGETEFKLREKTIRGFVMGCDMRMESPNIVTIKTIGTFSDFDEAQNALAEKRREIEREPREDMDAYVEKKRSAVINQSIRSLKDFDPRYIHHHAADLVRLCMAFEGATLRHGIETWINHPEQRASLQNGIMSGTGVYPVDVKTMYLGECRINGAQYPVIPSDLEQRMQLAELATVNRLAF